METTSLTLDKSVRLVILQFNFNNLAAIPASLTDREQETATESRVRKTHANGVQVIAPLEKVSIASAPYDLKAADYELVDTFYQQRVDRQRPDTYYHTVRFTFAEHTHATPSDKFRKAHDDIRAGLVKICGDALWRVRVFLNPYFKNDHPVPGVHAVSINLEARSPFIDYTGKSIVPPPKSTHSFTVLDGTITLVPV